MSNHTQRTHGQWGLEWEHMFFSGLKIDLSERDTSIIPPYSNFPDALRVAYCAQKSLGWDPKNPAGEYSSLLFKLTKNYLPNELREALELCCAIGHSLDQYHGADGFFNLTYHPLLTCVTIDLKLSVSSDISRNGLTPKSAVAIVHNGFHDRCEHYAEKIANMLKQRFYKHRRKIMSDNHPDPKNGGYYSRKKRKNRPAEERENTKPLIPLNGRSRIGLP